MATLNSTNVQTGNTVESNDILQLYDAFTAGGGTTGAYDVSISGSLIGLATSASFAVSASISVSSSFATTASFAVSASLSVSSSFATTASFAVSASRAVSSSFATTASFTPDAIVTASVSSNTITFTKGNSTTFAITVNTGSGAGGATSPGGSTTQIQYNNAGAFGGVPNLTWNGTTLNATGSFSGSFAGVYTPITVTAIDTIYSNYTITKPGTYIVQSADPTFTYAMGLPDPRAQPIGSEIKIINMDGANNLTLGNSSPYDLAGNAIGALAPQSSLKLVCFNIDGTTATNKWYSI